MRAFLLCLAIAVWVAPASGAELPLRSRTQLDDYLLRHVGSPLHSLSPGARERFLYSLSFNSSGLSGADAADLADELTQPQIIEVLALFGPEAAAQAPPSLRDEVQVAEQKVRQRDEIGAIERRYIDYYKVTRDVIATGTELSVERRAQAFDTHLSELYRPKQLQRTDDHELRLLRRAAQDVARATFAPAHVDAFRAVFNERQRRNRISSGDIITLQELLMAQRRFADARRVSGDFPGLRLARLPSFKDSLGDSVGKPTVWRLDASGRQLTREAVDLAPAQLLVTASCEHSRQAAADIQTDPLLGPAFQRHARWLSLAPGVESLEAAQAWNSAVPSLPILMIYDREEWRLLPSWHTPAFHVISEGRVIESIDGWDAGSTRHREQLAEMLRRHGLLESR